MLPAKLAGGAARPNRKTSSGRGSSECLSWAGGEAGEFRTLRLKLEAPIRHFYQAYRRLLGFPLNGGTDGARGTR